MTLDACVTTNRYATMDAFFDFDALPLHLQRTILSLPQDEAVLGPLRLTSSTFKTTVDSFVDLAGKRREKELRQEELVVQWTRYLEAYSETLGTEYPEEAYSYCHTLASDSRFDDVRRYEDDVTPELPIVTAMLDALLKLGLDAERALDEYVSIVPFFGHRYFFDDVQEHEDVLDALASRCPDSAKGVSMVATLMDEYIATTSEDVVDYYSAGSMFADETERHVRQFMLEHALKRGWITEPDVKTYVRQKETEWADSPEKLTVLAGVFETFV
jgi:hypothetical protein